MEDILESQEKDFFKSGIEPLQHRWQKCIVIEGDYAEKLMFPKSQIFTCETHIFLINSRTNFSVNFKLRWSSHERG